MRRGGDDTPLTIDGKQWICYAYNYDCPAVLDLGVSTEGKLSFGADFGDGVYELCFDPAEYTIEPIDETSGVIKVSLSFPNGVSLEDEYEYTNLTKNSVVLSGGTFTIDGDKTSTLATSKISLAE